MHYRKLGKTGIQTSILGFGAMRLPTKEIGKPEINHDEAIKIMRKGIDGGINYLDTSYNYHNYESELVVAKALKDGYRQKVTLVTKCPIWHEEFTEPENFEKYLEESLKKLEVDYLDIYLLHAINEKRWEERVLQYNLIELGEKAKQEGKIKYFGFSFHDKPEILKEILDHPEANKFDIMLIQYNLLDKQYEEMIKYANEKGLGIAIMGPVGGGRLAGEPPKELHHLLTEGRTNFTDLALKIVWSNPYVHVALSGMSSEAMVDDNLHLANDDNITLSENEIQKTEQIISTFKELSDIICTGCKYCMPCPNEVNISFIFESLIKFQVYGNQEEAKIYYSKIGEKNWPPGKNAEACIECGECEPKCPQKILIIEQLKKAHKILS